MFRATQLTCSVGIGPNKRLAKIAADVNKPNGFFRIHPDRTGIIQYVSKLPCRKVSGIGKVTESMLRALGFTTCGQLFENRCMLFRLFSELSFEFFMKYVYDYH